MLPGNSFNEALLNFLNRRYEYANINRGNSGLVLFATLIWLLSPYSRDNCTIYLLSCSEEGFKAVNISIANISFEVQLCEDQGICGKVKNLFSNMCL